MSEREMRKKMRFYMLDNQDSFVYNLVAYLEEEGQEIVVEKIGRPLTALENGQWDGIILSPGPGKPEDAKEANDVLERFGGKVPILGVCLGHQVIGYHYGGKVVHGSSPMHGKISTIRHNGKGLFYNLPAQYQVTRYHSLVIDSEHLPEGFEVDAKTEDGTIMAISQSTKEIYGVQFHPEALLTEYGHELIRNFISICEEHKKKQMPVVRKVKEYRPVFQIYQMLTEEEKKDAALLESSLVNELGQFSILGRKSYHQMEKKNGKLYVNGVRKEIDFGEYVKQYFAEHKQENPTALPLLSGAIGYFSYDYGKADTEQNIPESILTFYDQFWIEDCKEKELYFVSNQKLQSAQEGMQEILSRQMEISHRQPEKYKTEMLFDFTKKEYEDAIQRLKQYIIDGEVYIANMTQQLEIKSQMEPFALYEILRTENPSPFGGFLNYGGFQIVCASPERFMRVKDRMIETRPIKGTRKRGADMAEDQQLKEELVHSKKDRSELLMIVDLERNDLNKICEPGSVKVENLFTVESYATVHHLVAEVKGKLKKNADLIDVIEATFPGGSITGAPKQRAMEIIDELEHHKRGIYTGTIGYFSLDGDMDMNIVIRTAIYQNGKYCIGAGGGITCESEEEAEYEETLQKAKAFIEAVK